VIIAQTSRVSKAHISSMFLVSRRESRSEYSKIGACKFFSSVGGVGNAQDVVSVVRRHAPSCENALIFFLLV
jgi:hypothetical protein